MIVNLVNKRCKRYALAITVKAGNSVANSNMRAQYRVLQLRHVWITGVDYAVLQVLTMLCQILQTDDVNAIQAWLCSAGERGGLYKIFFFVSLPEINLK